MTFRLPAQLSTSELPVLYKDLLQAHLVLLFWLVHDITFEPPTLRFRVYLFTPELSSLSSGSFQDSSCWLTESD